MSEELISIDPKPVQRAKANKFYINNKDFTNEIIECKKTNELSPKATQFFITLANRAIQKLKFSNPLDREDCIQSALVDLVRYWRNFDPAKSNNAFAYYTQVAKNGYAKEYKRIHKYVGSEDRIKFVSLSNSGDSEIFTI